MKAHLVTRMQIEQGVKQLRSNIFRDVKLSRLRLRSTDFLKRKINNIQILNRSINTSLVIWRICVLKVQVSNQRRIQDCCNIQGGALCDNSQRLKAVNYYQRVFHLGCCSSSRYASGFALQFSVYMICGKFGLNMTCL